MRFMLLGGSGASQSSAEAAYELQVTATGYSQGLLATGVPAICPPTMITTGDGTLLLATGYGPMLRMRQNERVLSRAGVPAPSTPLTIASPPFDDAEDDTTSDTIRYVTVDYSQYGSAHSSIGTSTGGSTVYAPSYQASNNARTADLVRYLTDITYIPFERAHTQYNLTAYGGGIAFYTPEQIYALSTAAWAAVSERHIAEANRLREIRIKNSILFATESNTVQGVGYWLRTYTWKYLTATLSLGNPPWPTETATTTTYSGRYQAFMRYVDKDDNVSDPSPISKDVVLDNSPYILYRDVEVPVDGRVTRRQIFRNLDGSSDYFYLDIDTEDLTSTELISRNTDAQLALNYGLNVFDENGYNKFYLYGQPPQDKPYIAEFGSRVFAAGFTEYDEGNATVVNGSTSITGVGTDWYASFVGRRIVIDLESYLVLSCDEDTQVITIDRPYEGVDDPYADYVITPYYANSNLIYWTTAGYPEAWSAANTLQLPEDGDNITGLTTFANSLWILKERSIYQFNHTYDPNLDGDYKPASQRGCINQRCAIQVQNICLMLDRIGLHVFKGQLPRSQYNANTTPDHLSSPISDLFRIEGSWLRLNFNSHTCFWHGVHNQELKFARWFVTMQGYDYPQHAIGYDYFSDRLWVEEYPFPITSSCNSAALNGRPILGGPGGKLYQPDTGPLDLVNPTGATRLAVEEVYSEVAFLLEDTPPDCEGTTIYITAGRGRGQYRGIIYQSGNYIEVDDPWDVLPDTTSIMQIGSIIYDITTGTKYFATSELEAPQRVSVDYAPTVSELEGYASLLHNGHETKNVMAGTEWGSVSSSTDDPEVYKIDFTHPSSVAVLNIDNHRESDVPYEYSVSARIRGGSGEEKVILSGIEFQGSVGVGAP